MKIALTVFFIKIQSSAFLPILNTTKDPVLIKETSHVVLPGYLLSRK